MKNIDFKKIKQVARPYSRSKLFPRITSARYWTDDIGVAFLEEESAPPMLIFRLNLAVELRGIRLPIKNVDTLKDSEVAYGASWRY